MKERGSRASINCNRAIATKMSPTSQASQSSLGQASAATTAAATTDKPNREKKLYLLTDPGFVRQLLLQFLFLVSFATVVISVPWLREATLELYYQINDWMLATAHRYAWWSLLGLLSSSCCALQLLLNAMSMGCAGFNTVLGPWRPTLLAWTMLMQVGSWIVAWDRPYQWAPTATASVVVLSLALLPEILHYHYHVSMGSTHNKSYDGGASEKILAPESKARTIRFSFQMSDSVGCSACVLTISNALNKIPEVINIQACMETSILRVDCHPNTNQASILECLEGAGFPMNPSID